MSRSVVLNPSPRCPRCRMPPRWCICDSLRPIDCPLALDILMHNREFWRPTSTGHLVARAIPSTRLHVYQRDHPLDPATFVLPGRTLWVLHPHGEPLPEGPPPDNLQLLLLDGNWREASRMLRSLEGVGRKVSLPMTGESRYWLRSQQDGGRFSTAEALLFLFARLGLHSAHDQLRLQFELHVYAGLRSRGKAGDAAAYLAGSPLRAAFPERFGGEAPPAG